MRYGIDQARRGWIERRHVVNTMSWAHLQQWLRADAPERGRVKGG